MSGNIRDGLRMMDAVLTYGVDGLAEQNAQTALLKSIGLDPDVFFRELYVMRPSTESELLAQMDSGCLHTFIVGTIGCGKTTLLHHVLRQYCGQRKLPILLIDMKTAGIAKPDIYSIAQRIEDECKWQILLFLRNYRTGADSTLLDASAQPNATTLAMILLEPEFHSFISSHHSHPVNRLLTLHSLSPEHRCGLSFPHWLSSVLASDTDPLRPQVSSLISEFTGSLGLFEFAFAMSELSRRELNSNQRSKLIIAVDNLDAIEDPAVREQLVDWMRSQSSSYSAIATFTACIRPQNIPASRVGPTSIKGLWGEDGAPVLKLSIGETDVNEATLLEWEAYLAGQFYDRTLDEAGYSELSIEERRRQAFDDMVHVRRVNFVSRAINDGRISGMKTADLHAVSQAAKEVLNIGSIANDVRMQANSNRRVMLAGVANFLEYVVRDLELDWERVGIGTRRGREASNDNVRELRGSAIKSLYYRFLGSGHAGESQPPVFDARVFDPIKAVLSSGWKGRKLDPEYGTADVSRSCRDLLVMLGVYNACGNTLTVWSEYAVPARSVANSCAMLGLHPQDVYESIENVIRSIGVRFAGVFDIDHFLPIYRGEHKINGSERIIATDRCRRLLGMVVYMFNFLCERLKQNSFASMGHTFEDRELTYRGLVLPPIVDAFPEWLAKAALIETWWIEAVHKSGTSKSLKTAYQKYCSDFVVKKRHGSTPLLLTQGIARSAIAYLDYCLGKHIYANEHEVRECYKNVRDDLYRIDNALQRVCERLDRGETWGIPRNEALRY